MSSSPIYIEVEVYLATFKTSQSLEEGLFLAHNGDTPQRREKRNWLKFEQIESSRMTLRYFQPPTIHSIEMIHNTELSKARREILFSKLHHYRRS